jgi:hypothetical protein
MDHNESVRKFEHLMLKQADHARETAIELEALVSLLPSEEVSRARATASKGESQTSQGVSRTRAESPRKLEAEKQRSSCGSFEIRQRTPECRPLLTFDLMPIRRLLPLGMLMLAK